MENSEFKIYATGLNKQYWYLTLVRCQNILLTNQTLLNKWIEATGDNGIGLKKLIGKVEDASIHISLSIEETTLAYSAINILHQHYKVNNSSTVYEGSLSSNDGQPYLAQWHVFALNAFEDLYFNEDFPSFMGSVIHASMVIGKKETLCSLN